MLGDRGQGSCYGQGLEQFWAEFRTDYTINFRVFILFKKIFFMEVRDLALWYNCLPGKHKVVNWIPGTKNKTKPR